MIGVGLACVKWQSTRVDGKVDGWRGLLCLDPGARRVRLYSRGVFVLEGAGRHPGAKPPTAPVARVHTLAFTSGRIDRRVAALRRVMKGVAVIRASV